MKTVSSEDVKVVMFSWFMRETVGAAALWRNGMILIEVRYVQHWVDEGATHSDAFLGPLYRMIVLLPWRSRIAGKDWTSYSAQISASIAQSTLSRRWPVFELAESHSFSRDVLASLKYLSVYARLQSSLRTYVWGYIKDKISVPAYTEKNGMLTWTTIGASAWFRPR